LPVKIGAEVKGFELGNYLKEKKLGRFTLTVQYGLAGGDAGAEGLGNWSGEPGSGSDGGGGRDDGERIGEHDPVEGHLCQGARDNYRALHPHNVVACYCGEGSSTIGLQLGIRGQAITYCSGCASGNDAIGYAAQMIRDDEADVIVAGGSEEMVEMMHIGFCRLRAMSEKEGEPAGAMRPFDKSRDGFVLGEGAAFVVLEELSRAAGRGARIYAEFAGNGRSCDAYHATDPHPEGLGYGLALEKALRRARLHPTEVDYINAHGSATPLNDPIETKAIKRVFKEHARRLAVSATKPVTGHMMGSAGAIETVICALTIWHQEICPTINLEEPEEGCDLDYVPKVARAYPVRAAVNLNAGFGGRYACLVLKRI
jgi:3-oxoacyl-[acyl-carrier-protein] synthase II